jgi:hypothetical protein
VITDGRAFQTAGVLIADIIQVKRGKNVGCPELLDKQWRKMTEVEAQVTIDDPEANINEE